MADNNNVLIEIKLIKFDEPIGVLQKLLDERKFFPLFTFHCSDLIKNICKT